MFSKILDLILILLKFLTNYQEQKKISQQETQEYNDTLKKNIQEGNLDELLK